MSTLLDIINDYRRRLLAGESRAQAALDAFHIQTLAAIQPALDRLYQQMTDALTRGEQIDVAWLMQANRLELIKKLISGQIDQYGALALATTGRLQQDGVHLGLDAALAMLNATRPPGIAWSFGIPSVAAIQRLVGATQAGSPLATLFRGFGAEAAQLVERALITGVTLGWNPRRVAPLVKEALGVSRNRALTTSRTEFNRAYRDSSLEVYKANSDVVMKYRRTCAKSARTCAACLALDGTLYDLDTDFALHPCDRCAVLPVTKSWGEILGRDDLPDTRPKIETGADWFARQTEDVQRRVLGNAKYDAWQSGKFDLKDIVKHSHSEEWGKSISEKPLRELVGAKK